MRREFRGKLCAYCGEKTADTDDHVFGRGFFPVALRGDLPIVPACEDCNRTKSDLERYAMAVFPFGSNHPAGSQMLQTKVKSRLAQNIRLLRELKRGTKDVRVLHPNGSTDSTIAIPFEAAKAYALFALVVRGLLWHHLRAPLPRGHLVRMLGVTRRGRSFFEENLLSLSPENLKEISLADGAASYSFTHSSDDPFFSVWMLDIYGSMNIGADAGDGKLIEVNVAAITGPPEVMRMAERFEETGNRGSSPFIIPLTT